MIQRTQGVLNYSKGVGVDEETVNLQVVVMVVVVETKVVSGAAMSRVINIPQQPQTDEAHLI